MDWESLIGNLGNTLGSATAAYLPYEAAGQTMEDIATQGPALAQQATELGQTAAQEAQFTPFTVKTATGGTTDVGAGGGYTLGLGTQEQAIQQAGLEQAQAMMGAPVTTADQLFQQMQAAQAGETERARLELENRLAAQGRLGTQTAAYGGTPEALAMEKALAEQTAQNYLSAQQLAPQIAGQQITNTAGMLANAYNPQAQALAALQPAQNFANTATSAGLGASEAIYKGGIEGLESQQAVNTALANLEASRVNALADSLSGLFSGTTGVNEGKSPLQMLIESF
jgi:hypothetical protein